MKKEPLNEKLIKRIYGISGPLDDDARLTTSGIKSLWFSFTS